MSKDFSSDQGGIQPSNATGREPKDQGGAPGKHEEAPHSELGATGAGPGVGNTRKGIH